MLGLGLSFLLLPSPASAASAAVVGPELLIGTNPGEDNRIIVERIGSTILISDTAGLEAGNRCKDQGENISCKAKGVVLVAIHAGDGNDTVRVAGIEAFVDGGSGDDRLFSGSVNATLVGGPGDDRLRGGDANDVLRGGAGGDLLVGGDGLDNLRGANGDDRLKSKDRETDTVSGGGGTDEGTVDQQDDVRGVEVLGDF